MTEENDGKGENNSNHKQRPRPVVLLLLDGWGIAPAGESNAISASKTSVFSYLVKEYPVAVLTPGHNNLNARYLSLGSGRDIIDENMAVTGTLTAALSAAGLKQIKISETERFAALTHFFNGHAENKLIGEDWRIVSSEAGDHTVKPALAMQRTVKEIIKAIEGEEAPDLIIAAIPYLDLVAASGDFVSVKKAVLALDKKLKDIVASISAKGGMLIISSACGNAERMRNLGIDMPDTNFTDNPVPLLFIGPELKGKNIGLADPLNDDLSLLAPIGSLADLAPTILNILEVPVPREMTGTNLIDLNKE